MPGGVRVTFVPPSARRVGETGVGAVVLESDLYVPSATVRVAARPGLVVTNAGDDGVLWSGHLPVDQHTTLPVRMKADEPGTRGLTVSLSSGTPEANATLDVTVPGFIRIRPGPSTDADAARTAPRDVTLVFNETDICDALYAVGRQTGLRIELAPEVKGQRVNAELREVPAEAALRIICEGSGYRITPHDGGYRVWRP